MADQGGPGGKALQQEFEIATNGHWGNALHNGNNRKQKNNQTNKQTNKQANQERQANKERHIDITNTTKQDTTQHNKATTNKNNSKCLLYGVLAVLAVLVFGTQICNSCCLWLVILTSGNPRNGDLASG